MAKLPNTSASPYTGWRFALDIWGRPQERHFVACVGCGKMVEVPAARVRHVHCARCEPNCSECWRDEQQFNATILYYCDDNEKVVELDGRKYGFFAQCWWRLDRDGFRIPGNVKDEKTLRRLSAAKTRTK